MLSDVLVGTLIDGGDVHHIFPKEYLKQNGKSRTQYNQVANYTYLDTPVNISIGKKAPAEYFAAAFDQCETGEMKIGTIVDRNELDRNLEANCIPAEIASMGIDDYETKFLPARRRMMAAKVRKYYKSL